MLKEIIKLEQNKLEERISKNKLYEIALKVLALNIDIINHGFIEEVFDGFYKNLVNTKQRKKNDKNRIIADINFEEIKKEIEKIYEIKFDNSVVDENM